MKKIWVAFICSAIAFAACKKKEAAPQEAGFTNRLTKDVTLTLYPSFEDYSNGTNAFSRKVVKPGITERIPLSTFAAGKTYYMDWHTDNYYQNNWFNDEYPQQGTQVAIKPIVGNSAYYFEPLLTGNGRIIFLSANGTSSKWRAIDAYLVSQSTGYVSFWNSLTDAQKMHEITINKGFYATHNYKTSNGANATETLKFKVMRTEEAYIQFQAGDSVLGSMISGKLPTAPPPNYTSNSKDTVMALLPQSDYYFMMVRTQ